MPTVKLTAFAGIKPRFSERLIDDNAAVIAENVGLESGEISTIKKQVLAYVPNKPLPPLAIFRMVYGDDSAWLTWPYDVDVARAPFDVSVEPRYYWTGDSEPRFATYTKAVAGGGGNYPATFNALGIPTPVTAPTVTPSGGTGTNVTRSYAYTFFSELGEESGPSPASASTTGKVDATWAISGMDAFPVNSGTGTVSYSAGFTEFTNSGSHWLRVGDEVTISSTEVVVTAITATNKFKVAGDFTGATAWARVAPWNTTNMKRRLYRTSGTAADFQLVNDNVGTTYNDTVLDANMPGDSLISIGWQPPPVELKGLFLTAFGSLAGFSGNILYLSEPYQPHAWKADYEYSADYEIVAAGMSGNDIAAATKAVPYIGVGSSPDAIQFAGILGNAHPCQSKRSGRSIGTRFVFASPDGIVSIENGVASIITQGWFATKDWALLNPSSMVCESGGQKLYVGYTDYDSNNNVLVFDQITGYMTTLSVDATEIFNDLTSGLLYFGTAAGIELHDPDGGVPLPFTWKSKEFIFPKPVNLGAAKVKFVAEITQDEIDAILAQIAAAVAANNAIIALGNARGAYGYTGFGGGVSTLGGSQAFGLGNFVQVPDDPASMSITFTLFSKGELKFSRTLSVSDRAFKLPAGYKTDAVSVQVSGQSGVAYILIAETMDGLKLA